MKRHPEHIDFEKLSKRLESQIKTLEDYAKKLKKNKKETDPEKKFVSDFSLPDIETEIEVKKALLKEYSIRAEEWNAKKERDWEDYKKNFKRLLTTAKIYKSNLRLPTHLRKHIGEVLKFDYKSLKSKDDKIAFFLALKKEVELCRNALNDK